MTMKNYAFGAAVIGVLAVSGFGLATAAQASAAPTATTAADTVATLQANGYRVILNKVGADPLSQCAVTGVRPGRAITDIVPAGGGDTKSEILYTTVYVDVRCPSATS
jgi:hypothetical protein